MIECPFCDEQLDLISISQSIEIYRCKNCGIVKHHLDPKDNTEWDREIKGTAKKNAHPSERKKIRHLRRWT